MDAIRDKSFPIFISISISLVIRLPRRVIKDKMLLLEPQEINGLIRY